MRHAKQEPFPAIYVDGKKDDVKYEIVSAAQIKKNKKIWTREGFKNADREKREAEDAERREKNLEEAKKITIEEDKSLPAAKVYLQVSEFPKIPGILVPSVSKNMLLEMEEVLFLELNWNIH